MKNFVCIDIGGTSIKQGVINSKGTFLIKDQLDTQAYLGGPSIIEKVKNIIKNYQSQYPLSGICISTAGMVDPIKGCITYASELIPRYTDTPIKKIMEETFLLPCEVENDVNCAGLAESRVGVGKDSKSCICLTIGTGIGGCMVYENQIFHGFSNSAFEIGYMDIGGVAFQDLASATTLVKNVAKRKNLPVVDGKFVFEAAKKGDTVCNEEIDKMIHFLSIGISNLCYTINPELVILGGGIMAQKEFLEPKLKAALKANLMPTIFKNTKIAFASNGNDAGMLGAFYHFQTKHIVD